MNKISAVFGSLVFILVFGGCGQQGGKVSSQPQLKSETSKNKLPSFLAGVWEVKMGKYKGKVGIKIEPDGSVSRALYTEAGPVYLAEGESYGEAKDKDENGYYLFTTALCEAKYVPETRVLSMKIVTDSILQLSIAEMKGGMNEYFEGPVSEDGRTWEAEWSYYSWLDEQGPPDPNTMKANPVLLIFTKADTK
ncbi:MAG: hypothetical protein PHQ35_00040 [Phycisphaerae bacterium]|nr:hypothetical protein [Phycisphaerae bacterium]MDD5381617.1 hypothetical protein [Phycisphaerae bacterium]